ncbi:DUF5320 domain-containing protein [Clostridium algidicarnis]|uniref:DUF5320 domain-containing protein n=1 Tax=Clostridium algidicarnis TaxID=37659 RepID=UPI001C0D38C0|nr:DUF5320 domain-containing protein [Clostridium algidicarnis]MBU3228110.1 DUF5320 domain-containing protein [Clostridium algidicarnis]MBU3251721.1 DUF5320 domain-containing protein [Clostridium algidicarnis]
MPRRDGTGSMTGRGLGFCTGVNAVKVGPGDGMGLGTSCRCGLGRRFEVDNESSRTQKQLLQEQKSILQNRLEVIDKRLENL